MIRLFPDGMPGALQPIADDERWHPWTVEYRPRRDGTRKATRVPYTLALTRRQNNTPNGLGTLAEALEAMRRGVTKGWTAAESGVGISTKYGTMGVVALDFDACFSAPGLEDMAAWALPLVQRLRDIGAYMEVSPSGLGLRVLGTAGLSMYPPGKKVWRVPDAARVGDKQPAIEAFNGGAGYVTVMGTGAGSPLADISDVMDEVIALAMAQTRQGVSLGGGAGVGAVRVQELPRVLPAGLLEAFLGAVPAEAGVVPQDNDEAVALYRRLAHAVGAGWDEIRPALHDWALGYDGDARWVDDLFANIGQHGVKVSHVKPLLAWFDGLLAPGGALEGLGDNAKGSALACAAALRGFGGGGLGEGLEQVQEPGEAPAAPGADEVKAQVLRRQEKAAGWIAGRLADRLRWIEERAQWAVRDGTRWRIAYGHEWHALVLEQVREIGRLQDTATRKEKVLGGGWIEGVVRLMRVDPRLAAPLALWDMDPWLLMTPGGMVVDLRDGSVRPGTVDDLMLRATGADPARDWVAAGPRWSRFIEEVFPNRETRRYVQKAFGLALIGRVEIERMFLIIGSGGTGKTTLVNAVMHAAGRYAEAVSSEIILATGSSKHAAILADLKGLRMAVAAEVDEDSTFSVGRVKKLTSKESIKAQYMRENWFEFTPSHTLFLLLNEMPRYAGDEAMERRIRSIEMLRLPAQVDPHLSDALAMEAGAVLAWAIEGAVLFGAEGLEDVEEIRAATASAIEGSDPLGAWFRQRVVVTGDARDMVSSQALLEDLKDWQMADRSNRAHKATDRATTMRIGLIAQRDRRVVRTMNITTSEGTHVRGYLGMRLAGPLD